MKTLLKLYKIKFIDKMALQKDLQSLIYQSGKYTRVWWKRKGIRSDVVCDMDLNKKESSYIRVVQNL